MMEQLDLFPQGVLGLCDLRFHEPRNDVFVFRPLEADSYTEEDAMPCVEYEFEKHEENPGIRFFRGMLVATIVTIAGFLVVMGIIWLI